MPARWLLYTTDYPPLRGGIPRMLATIVELSPPGIEWRCATIAPGPAEPGVFRYNSYLSLARSIPKHARWLRGAGRDDRRILCGHPYLQPHALATRYATGAKLTTIVHGTDITPIRPLHWAAVSLVRFSERVVAVSRFGEQETRRWLRVPAERLAIISPRFRSPYLRDAPPARRPDGAGLRLVTVSRLKDVHKNLELAIRAMSVLASTGLVECYTIVGDGPQRPRLEELARALGVEDVVDFAGELDDDAVVDVLASHHVALFPSRRVDTYFEGFGMIVHELAGAGLPVLVGDAAGTPDTWGGDWSILLDPDDLGAWVTAIERLAADEGLRIRLACEAWEWGRAVNPQATVDAYLAAIAGG